MRNRRLVLPAPSLIFRLFPLKLRHFGTKSLALVAKDALFQDLFTEIILMRSRRRLVFPAPNLIFRLLPLKLWQLGTKSLA